VTATSTTLLSYPLPRERNLILASLLLLAGAAWALLIWQATTLEMNHGEMSLTMGMAAPLFLALWVAMMVAIMFPTAAPMILMFARIQSKKEADGKPFVPTWVFVSAYILVWSATGIAAYGVAILGEALAEQSGWIMHNASRIGGGVLIVSGVYQLSPLKYVCLNKCRSPFSFILQSWRDGTGGSFRMGVEHAAYCLGCCWVLFAILFPLGMMNVAAMGVITIVIFAEKSTPIGHRVAQLAAVGLIAYGALVVFIPGALPTFMMDGAMASDMSGMTDGK